MHVVLVEFVTKPGSASDFAVAVAQQSENSLGKEMHCLVFDVCRDPADPNRFVLYEIYSDQSAFQVHLQSDHFKAFDQLTGPMIEKKTIQVLQLFSGR